MLVIANGAAKSGSTWLFNIISEMDEFDRPPAEFLLDQQNVNPEIHYDKLRSLLDSLDYSDRDYLIKNHFSEAEQRDLILSRAHVYVVDIERNLRLTESKLGQLEQEKRMLRLDRELHYPGLEGVNAKPICVAGLATGRAEELTAMVVALDNANAAPNR